MIGTIHETGGGVYRVLLEDGTWVDASLRGRVKQAQDTKLRVVVGDLVELQRSDDAWTIEAVRPRGTELIRRARGGRHAKVLAANLDTVLAVVAAKNPEASLQLVDRLLALAESSGMRPVIVVNKTDLPGAAEVAAGIEELYGPIGYRVIAASAESGDGLTALREVVCKGTSTFIGPSGTGKSSLLNALDPALELRTGELSRKTGTGRHTTVGSRLILLSCGGAVADTPGFGDVGLFGVAAEDVAHCFPEFARPADECRFRRCTHVHEPGCGVLEALEAGEIVRSRYDSYVTLRGEAEAAAD